MRGKGAGSGVRSSRTRITPAHAGKSRWYCPTFDGGGDHPRPCGEKQLRTEYDGLPSGSPPPMRGKGIQESGLRHGFRITPAHAGKSCFCYLAPLIGGDHPRPCGEKAHELILTFYARGSPPPMRGKGDKAAGQCIVGRITPAHAGKSRIETLKGLVREDHPRPCGEKAPHRGQICLRAGSPPPMRGKAGLDTAAFACTWITPAHAGKSC